MRKNKILIQLLVVCSFVPAFAEEEVSFSKTSPFILRTVTVNPKGPATLTHTFKSTDTVWFISQIYYGKGKLYDELLSANKIKNFLEIKSGTVLEIPNPTFNPQQADFQARLEKITQEREVKLIAKKQEKKSRTLASEAKAEEKKNMPADDLKKKSKLKKHSKKN